MQSKNNVELVDCPRDAIQGISPFIATRRKIKYINQVLETGLFECIDFGSFVSPRWVPQMRDTAEVLAGINRANDTKLLAIVANLRGAEQAIGTKKLDYIGYPFSIAETFQKKNTKSTLDEAKTTVGDIEQQLSQQSTTSLIVYLSMAFGNPYGDPWSVDALMEWIDKLADLGVRRFSLSDTTSEATSALIFEVVNKVILTYPDLQFSVHLHAHVDDALFKVNAAYDAGCRRFEGAMLGYGGCPFAQDALIGNIPSEMLVERFTAGNEAKITALKSGFSQLLKHEV